MAVQNLCELLYYPDEDKWEYSPYFVSKVRELTTQNRCFDNLNKILSDIVVESTKTPLSNYDVRIYGWIKPTYSHLHPGKTTLDLIHWKGDTRMLWMGYIRRSMPKRYHTTTDHLSDRWACFLPPQRNIEDLSTDYDMIMEIYYRKSITGNRLG